MKKWRINESSDFMRNSVDAQIADFLRNDFITYITREQGIKVFFEDESGYSIFNPREWGTVLNDEKVLWIDFSTDSPKFVFNGELGVNATSNFYTREEITGGYVPFLDSDGNEIFDSDGEQIFVPVEGIVNETETKLSSEFRVELEKLRYDVSKTYVTQTDVDGQISTTKTSLTASFEAGLNNLRYEAAATYITSNDLGHAIIESELRQSTEFWAGLNGLQYKLVNEYYTAEQVGDAIDSSSMQIQTDMVYMRLDIEHGFEVRLSSYSTIERMETSITAAIGEIKLSAAVGNSISTLTMTHEGVNIASADIKFEGMVTFTDLSTVGNTTIVGNNITSGVIRAADFYINNLFYEQFEGAERYKVIQVTGSGNYHHIYIGQPTYHSNVTGLVQASNMEIDATVISLYGGRGSNGTINLNAYNVFLGQTIDDIVKVRGGSFEVYRSEEGDTYRLGFANNRYANFFYIYTNAVTLRCNQLGFYNATPINQPGVSFNSTDILGTLNNLIGALVNLGLIYRS